MMPRQEKWDQCGIPLPQNGDENSLMLVPPAIHGASRPVKPAHRMILSEITICR
jgi:hypothetical protein